MPDRDVGLARLHPQDAADVPAAREIRIQRKGTIDQRHHRIDVLAETGKCLGGIRQNARVVTGHPEGAPGEISALQTVRRRIITPAIKKQP